MLLRRRKGKGKGKKRTSRIGKVIPMKKKTHDLGFRGEILFFSTVSRSDPAGSLFWELTLSRSTESTILTMRLY